MMKKYNKKITKFANHHRRLRMVWDVLVSSISGTALTDCLFIYMLITGPPLNHCL
jgi:hypothetical protein